MLQIINRVQNSLKHRISRSLSRYCFKKLNLRWQLRSGLTVKVTNQAEWVIYNDIFVDGEYNVPMQYLLTQNYQEPLLILDIGANVGYFTLRVADAILTKKAKTNFRIILFEGSPTTYQQLQSRIASEPLLKERVCIVHGLIGERVGQAQLLETDFHVMSAVVAKPSSHSHTVPYVDILPLIPSNARISLLKCDIEGSEQSFLQNYESLLLKTDAAVFELHYDLCDVPRCFEMLSSVGFSYQQILRNEATFCVVFLRR